MKLSQAQGLATERRAEQLLEEFLRGIPAIEVGTFSPVHLAGVNPPYDFMVTTLIHGQPKTMVVEVKHSGEPRFVRNAVDRLRSYLLDHRDAVPLVLAPYLSADARAICKAMKVGYLDFEGNCHLELENLFIDREVAGKPVVERRALKAIFRPRSARVLRALLGESPRAWRLGTVFKVARDHG